MDEMPDSSPSAGCELLILHTAEAQEWAEYLRAILESLRTLHRRSIRSYAVWPEDRGDGLERFHRSRCVVLLLTAPLLDLLADRHLRRALQRLLRPPRRVVALLCGVAEDLVPADSFRHWPSWSKLYAEDEPAVYISTVQKAMAPGKDDVDCKREATRATPESHVEAPEEPDAEEYMSANEGDPEPMADPSTGPSAQQSVAPRSACLTVQPSRIACGERTTIYIILLHKVDLQSQTEVEFTSEGVAPQRVPGAVENEYTVSVIAPDMPAGPASLTLLGDRSSVALTPVTYYTCLAEVQRHLESATSPVEFICQAFNVTMNKTESVDNMLSDLWNSRMPAGGLQLFGIQQIQTNSMSTYQRDEDLPTLLHFAAKYGLKKLTSLLLRCPGALQAYSVMNRHGDYPNTLAEHSGFTDLRNSMDEFVFDIQDEDSEGVYEMMAAGSENKYTGCTEDIYECMLGINPECAEDLNKVMTGVAENQNPEEAMLRTFFQAKPGAVQSQEEQEHPETEHTKEVSWGDVKPHQEPQEEEEQEEEMGEEYEEQEPYNFENGPLYNSFQEDIYNVIDDIATYPSKAVNRPPATMPRPENSKSLDDKPYIARVFSDRIAPPTRPMKREPAAEPERPQSSSEEWHTYGGLKTPGQMQLIALQERVKAGFISVNEAVQEFKAWQVDHERSNSLRCQQENLKRLRNSITRRHKERKKMGKNVDLEITAPIQSTNVSEITVDYSTYDGSPQTATLPPVVSSSLQRGNWKTGSTSSTSSTESNRLSTHSILSSSSGTEPDFEDTVDILPPQMPPRPPPRAPSRSPPPRPDLPPPRPDLPPPRPNLPPPVPERNSEPPSHERYTSHPMGAVSQTSSSRCSSLPRRAPPLPQRYNRL